MTGRRITIERIATEAEIARVDVDGRTVEYQDPGRPTGPARVLLHGHGTTARDWRWVIPALPEAGHRVITPNLPGHGANAPLGLPRDGGPTRLAAPVSGQSGHRRGPRGGQLDRPLRPALGVRLRWWSDQVRRGGDPVLLDASLACERDHGPASDSRMCRSTGCPGSTCPAWCCAADAQDGSGGARQVRSEKSTRLVVLASCGHVDARVAESLLAASAPPPRADRSSCQMSSPGPD
jgi:hypothetical protein